MPPSRPVTNTAIASEWGQGVHDRVFAAWGARVSGGAVSVPASASTKLPIDTAVEDPGGWADLANDRLVVPTGRAGLYLIAATVNSVNGAVGSQTRGMLFINGVLASSAIENNEGGTNVTFTVFVTESLSAGDQLAVYALLRNDSGADPSVSLTRLEVVFIADELGA